MHNYRTNSHNIMFIKRTKNWKKEWKNWSKICQEPAHMANSHNTMFVNATENQKKKSESLDMV